MNVSIIIITKNRRKELNNFLKQLQKIKELYKFEIVVVEASNENDISFNDIKYIKIPESEASFSNQRNIGVKNASYDNIIFIDDDVIVSVDWFKNMVNSINDNVYAMMCAVFPNNPNIIGFCEGVLGHPGGGFRMHNFANGKIIKVDSVSSCNTFFKKEVIEKVGYFSLFQKYGGEDTEISFRINEKLCSGKLFYNPHTIAYHKPRNSIKKIIPWYIKRGKGDACIFLSHKYYFKYILTTSILIKIIPILLLGIVTPWLILLSAIFWYFLQIKRYSFMKKYFHLYNFNIAKRIITFIIFPIIKFIADVSFDIGRIIIFLEYIWQKK